MRDTHFKIVIPMYNVEDWVETTIESVMQQNYKNFQCVIIDDISTDSSYEIVSRLIAQDDRFSIVKNEEKKFALKNIYEGIELTNPSPDDVIVNLDGDDWLANKSVLKKVNEVYKNNDILLTYGNHTNFPDGEPFWPLFRYPMDIVENNSFREFRFLASHLRTYKYKLWKKIKIEDLQDENGVFFSTGLDFAFMVPMLEMAGNRFEFIEDILYVYNNQNPLNDYKIVPQEQMAVEMKTRMKEKYHKMEFE